MRVGYSFGTRRCARTHLVLALAGRPSIRFGWLALVGAGKSERQQDCGQQLTAIECVEQPAQSFFGDELPCTLNIGPKHVVIRLNEFRVAADSGLGPRDHLGGLDAISLSGAKVKPSPWRSSS